MKKYKDMKILITGGTGFVGKPLAIKLAKEHEILVLTRSRSKNPFKNSKITMVYLDSVKNQYSCDLSDIDGVINLMGENIANKRWTKEQKKKIYSSRIDSTAKLTAHLKAINCKLQFFIQASAIGYYPVCEKELTEQSKGGEGFLADLCKRWENECQKIPSNLCERKVVVRIGVVLGRGGGAFERLHLVFKLGLGGSIAGGHQWMSWIHLNDLVNIFSEAVSNQNLKGIINAVSPNPVTNKDFTKFLASVLKRPALFPVPKLALKLIMGEMSCIVLDSQKVIPRNLLDNSFYFNFPTLKEALVDLCTQK